MISLESELKAIDSSSQVNELEGEVPLQKMQLSQVIKERNGLQKQLDTMTAQLANLEGQFGREKTKSSTLQVHPQIGRAHV